MASDDFISRLADSDPELLEGLLTDTAESIRSSGLDPKTHALVRLAALIATGGAPPAAYMYVVSNATAFDATPEEIKGVLAATATTVGLARAVAAVPMIAEALGIEANEILRGLG